MITTRVADINDFDLLATLGRRAFYEAFGAYNDEADIQAYLDLAFDPELIRKQLEDTHVIYFIAFYKNDPVGYAKIKSNSQPKELKEFNCMQLERIYSLQAYIGKSIGKTLMQLCIDASVKKNCEFLWLGVWQQNHHAIKFYKQWQFDVIGVKQFIIGNEVNDDFVMALDLRELKIRN